LEQSSTVLTQSLALSIQERWWAAGTPQRSVVDRKRRRLDYLMQTSNRFRWWAMNRDMAAWLEATRRQDREEDVMVAIVLSLGLPAEPPDGWKKAALPKPR
jgi:hypothetical protein